MCHLFVFYQILESKCIVCNLLLNRRTATWILFSKYLRRNEASKRENDQIRVNFATNEGRAAGNAHGGTSALHTLYYSFFKQIYDISHAKEQARCTLCIHRSEVKQRYDLGHAKEEVRHTLCVKRSLAKNRHKPL